MSTILPEFFLANQFLNISCEREMGCDALSEIGPPPNLIFSIPPPPLPPFMESFVSRLSSEGLDVAPENDFGFPDEGCNLCHWADGSKVGFVELAQKGPLIDDTWFLVIISSCVGVTLLGIIMAIGFLKYREGKLKPLSDVVLAKKEKALGLERCEAVLYPASQGSSVDGRTSRALWAGLKPLEGNHYTVDHCQPMDQKPSRLDPPILNTESNYDYADYSSITYTTIDPEFDSPCLKESSSSLKFCGRPIPSSSFENVGFVPGEEVIKLQQFGGNGCAVSRAAYLLGAKTYRSPKGVSHIYEMVTPKMISTSRRHKSVDHSGVRQTPIISAPTNVSSMRLPPLNSRYDGQYTLTAFSNGMHTLTRNGIEPRVDKKYVHVSLGRSGVPSTTLAPSSPNDNIYASPITSPVI